MDERTQEEKQAAEIACLRQALWRIFDLPYAGPHRGIARDVLSAKEFHIVQVGWAPSEETAPNN